ncbi:hypothetical protein D3C80_1751500 [compost metagenome]
MTQCSNGIVPFGCLILSLDFIVGNFQQHVLINGEYTHHVGANVCFSQIRFLQRALVSVAQRLFH